MVCSCTKSCTKKLFSQNSALKRSFLIEKKNQKESNYSGLWKSDSVDKTANLCKAIHENIIFFVYVNIFYNKSTKYERKGLRE